MIRLSSSLKARLILANTLIALAASDDFFEKVQTLWQVWFSRIFVTVVIIVVWEFLIKRPQRQAPSSQAEAIPSSIPKKQKIQQHRSKLLDQLEQEQEKYRSLQRVEDDQNQEENITDVKENEKKIDLSLQNDKKNSKETDTRKLSSETPSSSASPRIPHPIQATTNAHPGMQGFAHWYEVETSLFRIYTLGRSDGVQVTPPYAPHSYRGKVSVFLHVTNKTNSTLNIFWVDWKGKHVHKGALLPNNVWTQYTWIDHPWIFEDADTQTPYLYYIPYQVIPTTHEVPTINSEGTGQHKFSIMPSKRPPYYVSIDEKVMPFPAQSNFHTPLLGITWTLQHMSRMAMIPEDPSIDTLQKYLTNIINHPGEPKYRQLRIRSTKFAPIWQSPMRGLLLAVGFVEQGAYAELGCAQFSLSRDRVQEVAVLSHLVNQWRKKES